jgi:hypothetical protein
MTVLIGEVGGGGGGAGGGAGAGAGGGSGALGSITSATIAGKDPQVDEPEDHYLDITFVDKSNTEMGGK